MKNPTLTSTEVRTFRFMKMELNEEWGGFGYIRGRQSLEARLQEKADALVCAYADMNEWTERELFNWANSTYGRHYADFMNEYGADPAVALTFFRKVVD
jgi:hypothetical protein